MRTILHDWSDERATYILRNARAAIGSTLRRCITWSCGSRYNCPLASTNACSISGIHSSTSNYHALVHKPASDIIMHCPVWTGTSNATLALLELAPADGLQEQFEGFVYMDVQMLTVCDGMERSAVSCAVLGASIAA